MYMYTTIVYEWNSFYTFIQDETLVKLLSFPVKLFEQLCSIPFYDVCIYCILYRCNLCIITSVSLRVYIFYPILYRCELYRIRKCFIHIWIVIFTEFYWHNIFDTFIKNNFILITILYIIRTKQIISRNCTLIDLGEKKNWNH